MLQQQERGKRWLQVKPTVKLYKKWDRQQQSGKEFGGIDEKLTTTGSYRSHRVKVFLG